MKKEKEEILDLTISKARLGVVEPRVASNYIRIYIHTHCILLYTYLFYTLKVSLSYRCFRLRV